jgi:hypothetical protein
MFEPLQVAWCGTYYHAVLYFQTIDMFLLIPLYIVIIYIKSTNKIRFLLDHLIYVFII